MSRLKTLLEKAEQFLDGQWESFSVLDRWIRSEQSIPADIREEWKRIHELQEFFRREHFQKLVEEISSWEVARDEIRALRFVREIFELLEKENPSPRVLLKYLTRSLRADRGMLLSCSEESSQARVLATANVREPNLTLEEFQISRTVFREILRSGQGVLIKSPLEDSAYAGQTSILHGRIQSILAGAVRSQNKVIGILYLDSLRSQSFGRRIPCRSIFPPECFLHQPAGAEAASGRHPAAGRPLLSALRCASESPEPGCAPGDLCGARKLRFPGQRAGDGEYCLPQPAAFGKRTGHAGLPAGLPQGQHAA